MMMMDGDNPYSRIEVRDDGYLWLVDYVEDVGEEHQQPLLLHAASALLRQLREKWHDDIVLDEEEAEADDEKESPVEEEKEAVEVPKEDSAAAEDTTKEKENPAKPDESSSSAKNDDNKNNAYRKLKRTSNLHDKIISTIGHIRQYKHDPRKKKGKNEKRETKVVALQKQRDRLQKQKEQQQKLLQEQKQDTTAADEVDTDTIKEEIVATDDDTGFQFVSGKTPAKASDKRNQGDDDGSSLSSANLAPQHPYVRMVRTLNSIRALVPVLLKMLFHPDGKNKKLKVGSKGATLTGNNKDNRQKCWLLGNYVFDMAGEARYKALQTHLKDLMELFLPYETANDIFSSPLEDWSSFWCQKWLSTVWVSSETTTLSPYDIIATLSEFKDGAVDVDALQESKQKIAKYCQSCDDKMWPKQLAGKRNDKAASTEQKQYDEAVNRLHHRISFILSQDFHGSRLSVYGSCLSNLSLKGSDVDLSLYMPQADRIKKSFQNGLWAPEKYEKEMTKLVRDVFHRLVRRKGEFAEMVPVTRARVPVVKGSYLKANNPHTVDGSLHFDICFLNDIAVANSNLLREYSCMHDSVRDLMMVVKQWAKENHISSAQDKCISSYAWMNMVVFYLQCIDFVPNLQCPKLMEKLGCQRDLKDYWHNVNDLDTFYLTYEQVKTAWKRPEHFETNPVSKVALLYGFFNFYVVAFSRQMCMVSIKRGKDSILPKTCFPKCTPFYCIEDPFETFHSHVVHDLGVPVNEPQCHNILSILEEAERHLRKIVLGYLKPNNDEIYEGLWPSPEPFETKKGGGGGGGDGGKKKNKKRNKKGGKGGGGGAAKQQQTNDGKQPQAPAKPVAKAPVKGGANNNKNQNVDTKQPPKGNKQKGPNKEGQTQPAGQNPSEVKGQATAKQQGTAPKNDNKHSDKPKAKKPRHFPKKNKGKGAGGAKSDGANPGNNDRPRGGGGGGKGNKPPNKPAPQATNKD